MSAVQARPTPEACPTPDAGPTLGDRHHRQRTAEGQAALIARLRRPLLRANGPGSTADHDAFAHAWRYDTAHYRRARAAGCGFPHFKKKPAPATPWDPGLQHTMNAANEDVHEEAVLDTLLEDLKR